jgi:2'-5' RNA ligase
MFADPSCTDRIDSFALVSYIPEPLAGFLNGLRRELVPDCFLRAHVTILPPRPCTCCAENAWEDLHLASQWLRPFDLELNAVEVFPVSDVIYISLGAGRKTLEEMHSRLDLGGLKFKEGYPYHPHITLAQGLKPDQVDELAEVARDRWREYRSSRSFPVETLTFVQGSRRKTWFDLAEVKLNSSGGLSDPLVSGTRPNGLGVRVHR